jgi:hypothetical protein
MEWLLRPEIWVAFSPAVEALNIRMRTARAHQKTEPVKLHGPPMGD